MNREVLIIGGGVIGLSIARELHKKGVRHITLVEKGVCGEESSWAAAGMLAPQAEADKAGPFLDLCCESRDLYTAFAEELLEETGIDVEFDRSGTLYLAFMDEDVRANRERFRWQTRSHLPVERLSASETCRAEPFVSPDVRESLFFPNDWQVENRKLLAALRKYAELNGIGIREKTRVNELIVDRGRITSAVTETGTILAGQIVLATGAWTSFIKFGDNSVPLKVRPIRGQILCLQTAKRLFQRVIYSRRGYIVPRVDGRILAGSTSKDVGFEKAVTEANRSALCRMAFEIAPGIANLPIADEWAGLRPMAADGLPILGEIAGVDGLFIATAHYRNGILLAPLTGKLIASKIAENADSDHLRIFSPERFRAVGIGSVG